MSLNTWITVGVLIALLIAAQGGALTAEGQNRIEDGNQRIEDGNQQPPEEEDPCPGFADLECTDPGDGPN